LGRIPGARQLAARQLIHAVALLLTTAAGVTTPPRTEARAVLITRAQLGAGWSTAPAPRKVPPLTCSAFTPDLRGIRPAAGAVSATFRHGADGPFLSQVAYAFASPVRAGAYWHRVVVKRLTRCLAAAEVAASTTQVSFRVRTARQQPSLPLGVSTASFAITAEASRAGSSSEVFLDALLLWRGSVVTELSTSTIFSPSSRSFQLEMGRLVVHRLVESER
jgi:hypothetical protein